MAEWLQRGEETWPRPRERKCATQAEKSDCFLRPSVQVQAHNLGRTPVFHIYPSFTFYLLLPFLCHIYTVKTNIFNFFSSLKTKA